MKSKYTYELQIYDNRRWRRDLRDVDYEGLDDKTALARFLGELGYSDFRVVRKQGRKIVKVIYQTK